MKKSTNSAEINLHTFHITIFLSVFPTQKKSSAHPFLIFSFCNSFIIHLKNKFINFPIMRKSILLIGICFSTNFPFSIINFAWYRRIRSFPTFCEPVWILMPLTKTEGYIKLYNIFSIFCKFYTKTTPKSI